jgi:thiol-disulfide isomerase/thioredoxin
LRAPVDTIAAPLFPTTLPWVNASGGKESILQRGRPMLVEFWDFCRPNSIRTMPYVKGWHERYAGDGLRVIGVHCPGFECSRSEQAVRGAVQRLEIEYPVLIDSDFEVWREYDNKGWPARYLFDGHARLFDYHYGEGGYRDTELSIQELLGIEREPLPAMRPEDAPDARLAVQTPDQPHAYSGEYEAGGVWVVLSGNGTLTFTVGNATQHDSRTLTVAYPGTHRLIDHECHMAGMLDLAIGAGVKCMATCFTPGLIR